VLLTLDIQPLLQLLDIELSVWQPDKAIQVLPRYVLA
jgi:hypothetical protein